MRPIDADALIKWVQECGAKCPTLSVEKLFNKIKDAPNIDAVPVVRCKDCKYWGMHKSLNVPWCFEMHIDKSEDGYCDCGKRSEE